MSYLPVTLSVDHPHPELEQWVADRFEALNGKKMLVLRREDMPEEALTGHPSYAKSWLWDVVPSDTQRILFMDFDIVPLRPMPEIPDVPFAAVPDAQWCVDEMRSKYPFFAKTRYVFNAGFFVARRDTRDCFNTLKSFTVSTAYIGPYGFTLEQTPMNHLIQSNFDVHWLPRHVHCLSHTNYTEAPEACLLHLTGTRSARWAIMGLMREVLGLEPIKDGR
jgi:hypothetical protein